MRIFPPVSVEAERLLPSRWDTLATALVIGFIVVFARTSQLVVAPLSTLESSSISLAISSLPEYAVRTALRMLIAMAFSLLFTFTYATLAAKNPRAERLLIPLLDILQSVPILGFISVTVLFFMSLAPGRILGAELAAVFAIFTSQAWNMAFSFYQSLRTVPDELIEAGRVFELTAWARFWRIEVPFAMPALIWNMMMSMSGSWFFVVAAEAISVGNTTVTLPGIGSYIASAIAARDLHAIGWAIGAMLVIILIYDQLLFRPLVAFADRFRFDQEQDDEPPRSWALTVFRRSHLISRLGQPLATFARWTYRLKPASSPASTASKASSSTVFAEVAWNIALILLAGYALWRAFSFEIGALKLGDVLTAFELGLFTMLRVVVLIALASLVWTPIGVLVGLNQRATQFVQPIAQFFAAFPANLLFPVAVYLIVNFKLNPDIWLSPLMVLGTQWYILFNVIAGASALPRELRDVATNNEVKGFLWWRTVSLPGVFPYYVTGAITASGGSWNASIVAELVTWGSHTIHAHGLGDYIGRATAAGDFHRIVLGIVVMSIFVTALNRIFWRPLYAYAERRFRLT